MPFFPVTLTPDPPPPDATSTEFGPEAYAGQLKQLLPPGRATQVEPGGFWSKVLLALADELARINGRAADLLKEWDPRTAVETLPDWERTLGIPDACVQELAEATADRQLAVVAKLTARGGSKPAFFIELAAAWGFTATITEFRPLRVGFRVGDRVYGIPWVHTFQVDIDLAESEHAEGSWEAGVMECVISRAAPSHAIVLFSYT